MFLGWYDKSEKKSAEDKLMEAFYGYQKKFGHPPKVAIVSLRDAESLYDVTTVEIRPRSFIPTNTFYVGIETVPPSIDDDETR